MIEALLIFGCVATVAIGGTAYIIWFLEKYEQ